MCPEKQKKLFFSKIKKNLISFKQQKEHNNMQILILD